MIINYYDKTIIAHTDMSFCFLYLQGDQIELLPNQKERNRVENTCKVNKSNHDNFEGFTQNHVFDLCMKFLDVVAFPACPF